ncbi:MAG: hypothetical protein ABL956_16835 [Hyphomonadaceae bacterium]
MSEETQDDAGRIVFCPARAFQMNFSFPDFLAAKVAARRATRFAVETDVANAIAYNRIPKLEARFTRAHFGKAFSVSFAPSGRGCRRRRDRAGAGVRL